MKSKERKAGKRKRAGKMLKKQAIFNLASLALIVILLNASILIYPGSSIKTRDNALRFKWLGFATYALVDDNPEFTSPIMVEKNKEIELEPGNYYWCVPFLTTCLKKTSFEVQSEVSLIGKRIDATAEEEDAVYEIENTGNVESSVEVRNLVGRLITGFFILEPGNSEVVRINETARIIATQQSA